MDFYVFMSVRACTQMHTLANKLPENVLMEMEFHVG